MLGVLVGFMEFWGIVLNWSCVQREVYVQDMVSGGLVVSVIEVRLVILEGLEMQFLVLEMVQQSVGGIVGEEDVIVVVDDEVVGVLFGYDVMG